MLSMIVRGNARRAIYVDGGRARWQSWWYSECAQRVRALTRTQQWLWEKANTYFDIPELALAGMLLCVSISVCSVHVHMSSCHHQSNLAHTLADSAGIARR